MKRLIWLLLFGWVVSLSGQALDSPIAYPVVYSGSIRVNNPRHMPFFLASFSAGAVGYAPTNPPPSSMTAYLVPGKVYTISGPIAQTGEMVLNFAPPANMQMYVNSVPVNSFSYGAPEPYPSQYSTPVYFSCTVRMEFIGNGQRLPDSPAGLAAGQATSLVNDKPIWYVGLGRTRTGTYAGAVGFRRSGFSDTDFFTPAVLSYDPIDSTEVSVIRVSNVLRQIFAREVLVDVQTVSSTSYRLAVYPRSQVGALSNGLYTLNGSPFVTYTVSKINPSGIVGVRIDRVEDGQTTWTSLQQVGSTMEHRDWRRSTATADSYTCTNFTSATAATVSATGPAADGSGTETPFTWAKSYVDYSSYDSTWGKELTQTIRGAAESVPLVAQFSYYTATDSSGGYKRRLKTTVNPDGSWIKYLYYGSESASASTGLVQRTYEPWLDGPSSPDSADTSNSKYTDWTYKNYSGMGGWVPLTSETHAPGGATLGKTVWTYTSDAGTFNGHYTSTTTRDDYASAGVKVTTVSRAINATDASSYYQGRAVSRTYADGRKESYAYFFGTWNASTRTFTASASGSDRLALAFHGQQTGGTAVASWANNAVTWTLDSLRMVANRSTVSETVVDTTGRTVFAAENVYTSSGTLERIAATEYRFDSHGRLTEEVDVMRSVGASEVKTTHAYNGPLPSTVTAPDGTVTSYDYDDLLRLVQTTEGLGGPSSYPAKIKQTKYDGANRPVQTYTCSCGTTFTSLFYDGAGRLDSKIETSPNQGGSLVTSYSYDGLRQTTTNLPTNGTRIEVSYLDTRPKSVTGTAEAPVYYEYGVNSTGAWVRTGHVAPTGSVAAQTLGWNEVQSDWLGRPVKRSSPTWQWPSASNNIIDVALTYGTTTGQLQCERTTLRTTGNRLIPDKLYGYGADGRLQRTGLDLNEDGSLADVSSDRISSQDQYYSKDSWGWTSVATTSTAPEVSGGLTLETSSVATRLTGFNNGALAGSGIWVIGDTTGFDASDRSTTVWEYVQPSAKKRWTTVTQDGASQSGQTIWTNGYAAESTSTTGAKSAQDFDSKGRLSHQYSRYNGSGYDVTTTYSYYGDTEYVSNVSSGGISTAYAYGWGTTNGAREVIVTDGAGKVTRTAYNSMDLPSRTWGDGTSPVESGYDTLGRRTSVTTWRSGTFSGANWPSSGGGDSTNWSIESATGLVNSKTYADGKQMLYQYTPLGQLAKRTDGRGIETTYVYFDGSNTTTGDVSHRSGELKAVNYTGGTPSVSYVYKRSGLPYQVTDVTGTRTFAYRSDLQPDTETLPAGFYGANRVLQSTFDTAKTWRQSGFQFKNNGTVELAALATFDASTGRVTNLAGIGASVAVGYKPYTDWVQTLTAGSYVQTRQLQSNLSVLQQVTTVWGGVAKGDYSGTINSRGLRETQVLGGAIGGGRTNTYGYDDRGQLTSSTNNSDAARNFTWSFDLAGNRNNENNNGAVTTYGTGAAGGSANSVNQYPSISGTQAEAGLHHDDAGNMDSDGTWNCTFDGENRLIQMVRKDGTKTLQFVYDYLGRRVKKTVRNGGATAAIASCTKFVWAGWKLVAELDAGTGESGSTLAKTYLWGPDFSGGAGAGGLLAVQQGGTTYYPVYDLHGNVTGYLDGAGNVAASFEYSATGQVIAASGSAASFAFGHATQYTDRESGWVYLGLRYYNPKHGRFINRDPIEERGGLNLYAYCGNVGPNAWDILGLECIYEYSVTVNGTIMNAFWCTGGQTQPTAEERRNVPVVTLPPFVVNGGSSPGSQNSGQGVQNPTNESTGNSTNSPTATPQSGSGSGGGSAGTGPNNLDAAACKGDPCCLLRVRRNIAGKVKGNMERSVGEMRQQIGEGVTNPGDVIDGIGNVSAMISGVLETSNWLYGGMDSGKFWWHDSADSFTRSGGMAGVSKGLTGVGLVNDGYNLVRAGVNRDVGGVIASGASFSTPFIANGLTGPMSSYAFTSANAGLYAPARFGGPVVAITVGLGQGLITWQANQAQSAVDEMDLSGVRASIAQNNLIAARASRIITDANKQMAALGCN